MYRQTSRGLEVLLVHPGGPFWQNKDDGAWSFRKARWKTARMPPSRPVENSLKRRVVLYRGFEPLGDIRQRGGKRVTAFAVKGKIEADTIQSTGLKSNSPRKAGGCSLFPKSTARRGSTCPQPT